MRLRISYTKNEKKREKRQNLEKIGGNLLYNHNFTTDPSEVIRKNEEKKKIRCTGKFIGLAMLIMVAISFLWSSIYVNFMASLGIDANTAVKWLNEPAILQIANQVLSIFIFTLPFLVILSGDGQKLYEIVSFQKPKKEFLLPIILISIGFCSFANIAGSVIINLLYAFGVNVPNPMPESPEGVFGIILTFVGSFVVPPLVEEFAMRGLVMGSLRKYGDGLAIIISALFFGLMHGNMMQIPFAFIVGIALGFAVIKTGSIWTGIIIHAINNGMASLISLATEEMSLGMQNAITLLYFIACLLCAFVGVILLKGRSREALELKKSDMRLTPTKRAKIFFTSPLIIVYFVFAAIQVLLSLG